MVVSQLLNIVPTWIIRLFSHRIIVGRVPDPNVDGIDIVAITISTTGVTIASITEADPRTTILATMYCEAFRRGYKAFASGITDQDIKTVQEAVKHYTSAGEPFPTLCAYNDLAYSKRDLIPDRDKDFQ
jgi:hypothetical protein